MLPCQHFSGQKKKIKSEKYNKKNLKRNTTSTTFSQQILCSRLLLAIISGQESNFGGEFKLKTCNNLLIRICCENIMDRTSQN